jgi:phosphopentomutase
MRAILLVMDSVGIGGAPDAAVYGDAGANTVRHIAEACARGEVDGPSRAGPLHLPQLTALGLGEACRLADGMVPPGLNGGHRHCRYGCAAEQSKGKDTPSGHWELAGYPVPFDWTYFPKIEPCFPQELITELCTRAKLPGILGDCHASGTEIITRLGDAHVRSGKPICYTSADSVFQIAAHEQSFGLHRLYAVCKIAAELVHPLGVGRVIARPFTGTPGEYHRTHRRRDYSVAPPGRTILDIAADANRDVVTIGKIDDIFAHRSTGRVLKGDGNNSLFDRTLEGVADLAEGGLLFANFVDFDTLHGHRRDVSGYTLALEAFDRRLGELLPQLRSDDLLIITADHGCDPTWPGTDHTREQVPVLVVGGDEGATVGARASFSDVGATIARYLQLDESVSGHPF